MELSELKANLFASFKGSQEELAKIVRIVEDDQSIFPFNEYEHLIAYLIEADGLSFKKYLEIRTEYIDRNPNLWIFEMSAPRGFGEKFAQTYINGMCPELEKPSKSLDPDYSGEYDFWLHGIKIEVKASRAVDAKSEEPLYMKALSSNTESEFLMNFQQLKPACCDVFVWIAVYRDLIITWVLGSREVSAHPLFSKGQHRGNIGNEGQLHVKHNNIRQLDSFRLNGEALKKAIEEASER